MSLMYGIKKLRIFCYHAFNENDNIFSPCTINIQGEKIYMKLLNIFILQKKKRMDMKNLEELQNMRKKMKDNFEKKDILTCAEQVLKWFEVDVSKPIPIVSILNKMDIRTFQKEMSPRELSAYISVNPEYKEKFGSTKIACVNSLDNMGHKRFALAHELAHYLFDYDETQKAVYYNTYRAGQKEEKPIEIRANFFAACLLMPEEMFKKEYEVELKRRNGSIPDTIASMAERFEVSPKAIQRRIEEVTV